MHQQCKHIYIYIPFLPSQMGGALLHFIMYDRLASVNDIKKYSWLFLCQIVIAVARANDVCKLYVVEMHINSYLNWTIVNLFRKWWWYSLATWLLYSSINWQFTPLILEPREYNEISTRPRDILEHQYLCKLSLYCCSKLRVSDMLNIYKLPSPVCLCNKKWFQTRHNVFRHMGILLFGF